MALAPKKPVAKTLAKPTAPVAKPAAAKPVAKPVAKPAAKPAAPVAKPAAKPAAAPVSSWAKKLKAMKDAWNSKKAESKGGPNGTTLGEGRFATKLTECRLGENDNGMYVLFEFTCVEGEEAGEKAVRFCNIGGDEKQLMWLQKDFRRLGIDVDEMEIDQIEEALKELKEAAPGVRINIKLNGDFTNVYIDKIIDLEEVAQEDTSEEVTEEASEEVTEEATEEEPTEEATEEEASEEATEEASEEEPTEEAAEEEPTEEEPAVEEETISMGDTVAYLVGKKRHQGVVKSVKGTLLTILDDTTKKKVQFEMDEVEKVAEVE